VCDGAENRWEHQQHCPKVELGPPGRQTAPWRGGWLGPTSRLLASHPPSASAPWRCGARPPTIGLGQTADGSPIGRVIDAKSLTAAPLGATAGRRRRTSLGAVQAWCDISGHNNDELRSTRRVIGLSRAALEPWAPVVHSTQHQLRRRGGLRLGARRRRTTGAARRAR